MATALPPFILASSSPRRLSLLADIGITPSHVIAADIDETPLDREKPRDLSIRLAYQKLGTVRPQYPQAIILAADTVVACGRRILPKAETADDVYQCMSLLSGRRHHVYTAMAMAFPDGSIKQRLAESTVIFMRMTPEAIRAYADSGDGIGKAGGYAIQGHAATYIRAIAGSYSAIVGLSLWDTAQMIRSSGYHALLKE